MFAGGRQNSPSTRQHKQRIIQLYWSISGTCTGVFPSSTILYLHVGGKYYHFLLLDHFSLTLQIAAASELKMADFKIDLFHL